MEITQEDKDQLKGLIQVELALHDHKKTVEVRERKEIETMEHVTFGFGMMAGAIIMFLIILIVWVAGFL